MTIVLAHTISGVSEEHQATALYVDRSGGPERISYGTYFNALPAGYWSHHTDADEVTLTVRTRGSGAIEVFASDHTSASQVVHREEVNGEGELTATLSLAGREKGGWFWFDLLPGEAGLELLSGEWTTESEPRRQGHASIGMTTVNKEDYCLATLDALADSEEALSVIDRIYVIDQGSKKVSDYPGYEAIAERLGEQFSYIQQANLGGSGGFSRSMLETLDAGVSDFTLLLDDDVRVEPEAIYRLVQFGRFATEPTIVGGHMLDMFNPTVVHAWAEKIDLKNFLWNPGPPAHHRHNFNDRNLRATTWAHRRETAHYTGWWMCLIPTDVMRRIGLSLPAFLKWDDAEYSIRAKLQANISTVSLPSSALWHVAWTDKDDSREWQAYFHARNRILSALLHSPYENSGKLLGHLGRIDSKHLLCMEYFAAHIRELAYRDILRGPEHLHEDLPVIFARLRALRGDFVENQLYAKPDAIPAAVGGRRTFDIEWDFPPSRRKLPVWTAAQVARHWASASPPPDAAPQIELVRRDATWWRMPRYDSVVVTDSARTSANVYRRDQAFFRAQFKSSGAALAELRKQWDELSESYRAAARDLTDPESWRATIHG
ncbi:glycosyltransferase [Bogoriella caseilytica]|uniref:Galactofuranosylgalactofuranosylrhamnosyl-N-acetylglucosaminyl-diphospho-decaprenol beta-1,5/1,6-galactofuranosyltransferase n=1 Tax=Bogoriella caseilytica TaxID=56055 RepID=A0A3N2BAD4_9MICO|nr:glycosyltransferase [Bogoriella caseilytica]ROR72122.1 galactofuranosylgalactofuranosylrhamnosyl-N-acetylglucosaminyl-diphospho-decaprenol beta-1,5/1,6-galactofuranosyltransferase [Bogoriella caseilytica]